MILYLSGLNSLKVINLLHSSDFSSPSLLGDSVALEVPGLVHHEFEVVVSVDGDGDVVVVLEPFVHGDGSVSRIWVSHTVVLLEGVEEVLEHFVFGFLSGLDVWVHFGVVSLSDIINVQLATAVLIHNLEGLLGDGSSLWVHFSSNGSQELVVVNVSAGVSVEDLEELCSLGITKSNSEIVNGFNEFLLIERHRVIIIGNLELSLKTSNTSSTSPGKSISELLQKLFIRKIHGWIVSNVGTSMSLSSFSLRLTSDWVSLSNRWLCVLVGPSLRVSSVGFVQFPGVVHHQSEILVVIN